jgi:hypothetical protein
LGEGELVSGEAADFGRADDRSQRSLWRPFIQKSNNPSIQYASLPEFYSVQRRNSLQRGVLTHGHARF